MSTSTSRYARPLLRALNGNLKQRSLRTLVPASTLACHRTLCSTSRTFDVQTSRRPSPTTLDPSDLGIPTSKKVWSSAEEAIKDIKSGSLVLSSGMA